MSQCGLWQPIHKLFDPKDMGRMNNLRWPCVYPGSMKRLFVTAPIAALVTLPLLSGCVERTVYVERPPAAVVQPGETVVTQAPPPPQQEVIVASPGPAYVWVPGYWSWHGRWVWVGGCWRIPPHRHVAWVGGHWAHRGHGYVWVGGYWR